MLSSAPIKAYFAKADTGQNHPAAWFGVIWFTILIWMVAQLIVGFPMLMGIALVDSDWISKMPSSAMGGGSSWPVTGYLLFTVAALIIYFARDNMGSLSQRSTITAAITMAVLSLVCFGFMMQSNDAEANAFLLGYIGKSPLVYLSLLLVFPIVCAGLFIGQRVLHKRSIVSMLTAADKFRWKRMLFSMFVFWAIAGGISFVMHITGNNKADFVFDASRFWPFFVVSLLFIPLQSATEETVLRGYLNQGLARIIKNPWIVFFITSAGFAALHLGNPEIAKGAEQGTKWMTLSAYFFFGFFACILTYIDGGLETAIGVHAANNLFAAVMMGYDHSALPTPTVFRVGFNSSLDTLVTISGLSLVCIVMYLTRDKTLERSYFN
ncbi:lysostaphin resistance A-like protein [Fretibacter rubidus]|uniref:CPBP family intramembrane glutamic endopeptidase n=1 Tax=Fretibacter rubidus TaxID=570162 RepID=UPI00352A273A